MNRSPSGDEAPAPGESGKARIDRELGELLQGLRVSVTGVQVLFAFLLTLPFQAGFPKVTPAGRWLFLLALLSSALTSVCFITPAAQHLLLFRTPLKEKMLRRANRIGTVGMVALVISMTSAIALVMEIAVGNLPAVLLGGAVALTAGCLWFLQPILDLHRLHATGGNRRSR
ncbi:DUF6328 family protein [Streptosporangium sp. NPDC006007]|uniref:DUF6328 family protein n=1 Tax=Streptosporangium sp. NPDC006007 TaxID=3154575 RepID=UPI0033ACEAD0